MAKTQASTKKGASKTQKKSAPKAIKKTPKKSPKVSKAKKNDPWSTPPPGSLREMIRSGQHVWGTAPLAVHPWWP